MLAVVGTLLDESEGEDDPRTGGTETERPA